MKGNKGITLIALVITIIVLLILAGVSIAMLSGDNSILTRGQQASVQTAVINARDDIALKVSECITEYNTVKYAGGTSKIYTNSEQSLDAFILAELKKLTFKDATVKIGDTARLMEDGFPKSPLLPVGESEFDCVISSCFRPYGVGRKQVRPVVKASGRAATKKASAEVYETHVLGQFNNDQSCCQVTCSIAKGFRHQVRCHLAWIGLPIQGDPVYSSGYCTESSDFFFTASGLQFPNRNGTEISFSI